MKNKSLLTKILAIAGTVLVWLPILAPLFFALERLVRAHRFMLDYLMPAELFPVVLVGGLLLLWACLRMPDPKGFPVHPSTRQANEPDSPGERPARKTFRVSQRLIIWSLGSAVFLLVLSQVLAMVTGLADGRIEPTGWQWALVFGSLMAYILAVITLGLAVSCCCAALQGG